MSKTKPYNLEERTLLFSKNVLGICRKIPKNHLNANIISQLIRSATSVGANYREANEALSKKDFIHRLKISRKECKESSYWLELLDEVFEGLDDELELNKNEARELRNILSAVISKNT